MFPHTFDLGDAGFDLELLGFDADELAGLLDPGVKEGLTGPDEVPEPPDEAITQPLKRAGLYFSHWIVWDKQHPVLTRKDFMGAFEIAFYGWKEGAAHHFYGPNNATDLWHLKKVNPQNMIHLTEKPVELAVRAIQYSSRSGENVLDLFGGSGSTLIGCEQTDRKAFLMELDPLYCDVIVQRFAKFSGTKAERIASDSATFQ